MNEWIDVNERMPEFPEGAYPSVHVIVARRYANGVFVVGEAAWCANRNARTAKARIPRWERGGRIYEGVTHWQPLPAPPEKP